MTPKQKAGKICRKMLYALEWKFEPSICKAVAKELALIAVDEIMNELTEMNYGLQYLNRVAYWEEVKQEIDKFKTK